MESTFKVGDIVTPSIHGGWLKEAYGARCEVIKVYELGHVDVKLLTRIKDNLRGDVIPGYVWKYMNPGDYDFVSHGSGVQFISLL